MTLLAFSRPFWPLFLHVLESLLEQFRDVVVVDRVVDVAAVAARSEGLNPKT